MRNVKLSLAGFYVISSLLGILAALIMQTYELDSITMALIGTIVIAVVFGIAGFIFPSFFSRIHGILGTSLIGVIIVEIAFLFLRIEQNITNWIVLIIFCGFIGYDFYQAAQDYRSPINAVLYATELYLDLLNVFLRLLFYLRQEAIISL